MITKLTENAISGEFDYTFLMSQLSHYKNPRNQIGKLLKTKMIVRVKKGLYVFGADVKSKPYSLEVLANLIYGPSYVSAEYALSYHGLIPERAYGITSTTNKRKKQFHTPVGDFSYQYLSDDRYVVGVTQVKIDEVHYALMATPEKALIDKLYAQDDLDTTEKMTAYLTENLRIEKESLAKLSVSRTKKIAVFFGTPAVNALVAYLESIS